MLQQVKAHRSAAPFMQRKPSARKVETRLRVSDHLGALALRFGIGRNNATIQPGLYYTGNPGAGSPVLVTANYRLTVDALRRELTGISTWVLIIDTGGINIWCAAGKGTFSAQNIANTLNRSDLDRLAPSAPLVLPQLSASGVDANELASLTGRRILFGPVYARDIPRFLESGFKKDTAMRAVRFATPERAVLVPVELMHTAKLQFATLLLSVILALPVNTVFFMRGLLYAAYLEGSLLVAIVLFPLLLPLLPGRFFSVKGTVLHVIWSAFFVFFARQHLPGFEFMFASLFFLAGGCATYLTMNFTGSSTFTSQRGVEREVRKSIPVILISSVAGMLASATLLVRNLIVAGGIL
ncbi:MAG TPA: mercury methylation corrinoid protein HgcA [Treponemataceae bacterium]|jgi:hypothetical protein|nr:mercury methylation corrinoid protein HgcA [Treponemataceae bacterium]HOS35191.1 mercury methylation corrinoid protein HgcA [Treponemataceae bacterium]HOU38165.1 mercury methylation corrinoid protein HgcA [Treponemataceae bacterium]HPL91787.1 mercury methylation corrinoid protein HgcA [Treponemataceae bacterium]HPX13662.1 mercury methylation corrinoid protein HgcA [Treponemataceae bacterium]